MVHATEAMLMGELEVPFPNCRPPRQGTKETSWHDVMFIVRKQTWDRYSIAVTPSPDDTASSTGVEEDKPLQQYGGRAGRLAPSWTELVSQAQLAFAIHENWWVRTPQCSIHSKRDVQVRTSLSALTVKTP